MGHELVVARDQWEAGESPAAQPSRYDGGYLSNSHQDRLQEDLLVRKFHFRKTQSSARATSLLHMSPRSLDNHQARESVITARER